jgi:hypothetical protein
VPNQEVQIIYRVVPGRVLHSLLPALSNPVLGPERIHSALNFTLYIHEQTKGFVLRHRIGTSAIFQITGRASPTVSEDVCGVKLTWVN